jgi:hypothetical protein
MVSSISKNMRLGEGALSALPACKGALMVHSAPYRDIAFREARFPSIDGRIGRNPEKPLVGCLGLAAFSVATRLKIE